MPYPEPERLVRLVQAHSTGDVTIPEYEFVKAHSRSFVSVAAYRGAGEWRIGPPENHNWITAIIATAHFLRTLGVQPQLGREFTLEETVQAVPLSLC